MGQNIEALQCAEEKNYADAVSYWKESSNLGYAKAQFNLGICYETGQGIKQSLRKVSRNLNTMLQDEQTNGNYCNFSMESIPFD